MPKIPYTKLYMSEWAAWRSKLSAESLCQILDAVSDYCNFGEKPEVNLEDKLQDNPRVNEVLNTMMKWAGECEKAYKSNLEKGKKGGRPKIGTKKPGVMPEDKPQVKPEVNLEDKLQINLGVKQPELKLNKENTPKGVSKKESIDWGYVLNRWNEIATKWKRPTMRALTESRKKHFAARFKEYRGAIEQLFDEIDYRFATSLSLRGKQMNREGEVENSDWGGADFDFLCRPEKFLRIIEGGYRDQDLERQFAKRQEMSLMKGGMNDAN